MQVDPIDPTLKAPGSKRLKLNCDEPLSNFAFKFNLRRYSMSIADGSPGFAGSYDEEYLGRAVQVDPIKPTLKAR